MTHVYTATKNYPSPYSKEMPIGPIPSYATSSFQMTHVHTATKNYPSHYASETGAPIGDLFNSANNTNHPLDFLTSCISRAHASSFKPSPSGSTGITFLPVDTQAMPWVVKWQNPALTEVEYICTRFYARAFSYLSIPDASVFINDNLLKVINDLFKNNPFTSDKTPMLLSHKGGITLAQAFSWNILDAMDKNDKILLFTSIGTIAGYDLFIANFDRFLDFRKLQHDASHRTNGGNLLIEFNQKINAPNKNASPNKNLSMRNIHVIDISPASSAFFAPAEIRESLSDECICVGGGLFDEEEESPTRDSPACLPNEISGEELRNQRHNNFCAFMTGDDPFIQQIATHIFQGLAKEQADSTPNHTLSGQTHLEEALMEGLVAARVSIRLCPAREALTAVQQESFSTEAAAITLAFLDRNISYLEATCHS